MTRLSRYVESRGFWAFVGALLMLLILRRYYLGIVVKDKPGNVTPIEQARAS